MFVLTVHQRDHVDRLAEILSKSRCAVDLSEMGYGKTVTAVSLATVLGYDNVMVISPASTFFQWERICGTMGIELVFTSYEKLALMKEAPSLGDGVFVVMDEAHRMKSVASKSFKNGKKLLQGAEKFLLMSGTLFDKKEFAGSFLSLVGVTDGTRIFDPNTMLPNENYRSMIAFVRKYKAAYEPPSFFHQEKQIIYDTLVKNVLPFIASKISSSETGFKVVAGDITVDATAYEDSAENTSTDVEEGEYDYQTSMAKALSDLDMEIVRYNTYKDYTGLATVIGSMAVLDRSKAKVFADLALKAHSEYPACKIAIVVNFKDTLTAVVQALSCHITDAERRIVVVDGSVTGQERKDAIAAFQRDDLHSPVFLVANSKVVSVGIDLDDQIGTRPRIAFVSPSFAAIDQYQIVKRFCRQSSKSDAFVNFVYTKQCFNVEKRVISILSTKNDVLRGVAGHTTL